MKKIIRYLKSPWSYWLGGILLGLMNALLLALAGVTWQVTGGFLFWGAGVLGWFGLNPLILHNNMFINQYSLLNFGVIVGALVATLLASQFKFKKIKNKKQVIVALIGGIMMGYGSRLAAGCNIGAFFSGIPSFSLHGWVFGIFIFLGTGVGIKILKTFIL